MEKSDINLFGYSKKEELLNTITHLAGVLLSIAATSMLIFYSLKNGVDGISIFSYAVFGGTMFTLYLSSTLYHFFKNPELKLFFKKMDHASIFLLIAGSYTPFTLLYIKGVLGYTIFSLVWVMAISGIFAKFFWMTKFKNISSFLYLAMGWICIVALKRMFIVLPHESFIFLVAGGVTYSVGVIFYAWKKLKFGHAVWHLFVLGGSAFHFVSVLQGLLCK